MKTDDRRYPAVLALFGLVMVCTLMSATRRLMDGILPMWAVCCQSLRTHLGHEMSASLPLLVGIVVTGLLSAGAGIFLLRAWKTQRVVAQLNSDSAVNPAARLTHLLASLALSPYTVVLATGMPLAFCFGLLRPRICISTGLAEALTDRELKAVLLHEDHHRRRYDPLRGLLAEVLAKMLFFLPVAAELRDLYLTATELEADRHAVRFAGRPALAGALHKIITHPLTFQLPVVGVVGISNPSTTEIRIAELLGDRSTTAPRLSVHSLMSSSAIIMLGCMLML